VPERAEWIEGVLEPVHVLECDGDIVRGVRAMHVYLERAVAYRAPRRAARLRPAERHARLAKVAAVHHGPVANLATAIVDVRETDPLVQKKGVVR